MLFEQAIKYLLHQLYADNCYDREAETPILVVLAENGPSTLWQAAHQVPVNTIIESSINLIAKESTHPYIKHNARAGIQLYFKVSYFEENFVLSFLYFFKLRPRSTAVNVLYFTLRSFRSCHSSGHVTWEMG